MPIPLGELQSSKAIQAVAKFCPTSDEFISLMNEVDRKLERRGDFSGTVIPIYVCAYNGCITWPRYVSSVRAVNLCHRNVEVKNGWWDFMLGQRDYCRNWAGLSSWRGAQCTMVQTQKTSVFQDIQGDGRYVRAYARCQADLGKTLTIFGTDNNGQPLMQRDINNNWIMGQTITLANPFGSTMVTVRSIDYVLKDLTQCPVDLYAYNPATDTGVAPNLGLEDLAHYDPSELRPSFQRTRLGGMNGFGTGCGQSNMGQQSICCGRKQPMLALVKLKHIDALVPTDLLVIDNIDAFVLEVQATKLREAGDFVGMKHFQAEAISELNRQLEDDSPDDQFSSINNVFGGASFSQQCF